jgi:hypothetical protein
LTLVELADMAAGFNWRQEQVWDRLAWAVSHLLNVSGKTLRTRITPKRLLHRPISARDQQAWWDRIEAERKSKNGDREN